MTNSTGQPHRVVESDSDMSPMTDEEAQEQARKAQRQNTGLGFLESCGLASLAIILPALGLAALVGLLVGEVKV